MQFLATGTWVVVADGAKAIFLENQGDTERPALALIRKAEQDNPPTREQGTDRPGRLANTGGGPRAAMEPTDFHRQAEDRFARDIAAELGALAAAGRFSRLVLVAPPQFLGSFRAVMPEPLAAALVAEVPKTLTQHPLPEIARLVVAELARA